MNAFFEIILCLGLGWGLRRRFPSLLQYLPWLIKYLIWGAIPAVALLQLSQLPLSWAWLQPVGTAWLVFGVAIVGVWSLRDWLQLDRASLGCLMLMAGLGNTSFVGFPLMQAFYGPPGLQIAVLVDQPGSFLALGTLGIWLAALHAREAEPSSHPLWQASLRRVLRFPPFLACVLALILNGYGLSPSGWLELLLKPLAASLAPLALFVVGLQWQLPQRSHPAAEKEQAAPLRRALVLGLGYQLLLAPALIFLLYRPFVASGQELSFQVCVLEAGMAPMISAAIVAGEYGLNPQLASLMTGLGIPLSLLSVPLWHACLLLLT